MIKITNVLDFGNNHKCSLCGNDTIHGFVFPYNPIKKWYYRKPRFNIIWLCEKCQHINIEVLANRKSPKS